MESELESIVDSARETILKQKRVEILWEVRVQSDTVAISSYQRIQIAHTH